MFGVCLSHCGPRIFGVRIWCDWRKILVLQLVVPKVNIFVKKGTSLIVVYFICIVYFGFVCFFCQYVVGEAMLDKYETSVTVTDTIFFCKQKVCKFFFIGDSRRLYLFIHLS